MRAASGTQPEHCTSFRIPLRRVGPRQPEREPTPLSQLPVLVDAAIKGCDDLLKIKRHVGEEGWAVAREERLLPLEAEEAEPPGPLWTHGGPKDAPE
jgi:hypothetical protein